MKTLTYVLRFVRLVTPWAIRFIFFAINSMLMSWAIIWKSIREEVNGVALRWTATTMAKSDIPLILDNSVLKLMQVLAWLMTLFGFILTCHLVVWIFWRIL